MIGFPKKNPALGLLLVLARLQPIKNKLTDH